MRRFGVGHVVAAVVVGRVTSDSILSQISGAALLNQYQPPGESTKVVRGVR